MVDYAEEKDRFECRCMGEKNKRVLIDSLKFKKDELNQFEQTLQIERKNREKAMVPPGFGYRYKQSLLELSDSMISKTNEDIIHVMALIDDIRNVKLCGD